MSLHIVLVESDVAQAAAFQDSLVGQFDVRVTVVRDGGDLLTMLESGVEPDAAVITWQEGEYGGLNLVRALRQHLPDMPVLALADENQLPLETGQVVIQGVLAQPLNPDDVPGVLAQALGRALPKKRGPVGSSLADVLDSALASLPQFDGRLELNAQQTRSVNDILAGLSQTLDGLPAVLSQDGNLIASAGPLSQQNAEEFAHLAGQVWGGDEPRLTREVIRFDEQVRTEGTERHRYMLYSVHVAGSVTLSVAWETSVELSVMRAETLQAAQAIRRTVLEG
jgi:CheY-like chemotaxis protein